MKVMSTRSPQSINLSAAIVRGLADDGGLYVPETFPKVSLANFSRDDTYPQFAAKLLQYFFHDEILADRLDAICQRAFNFPVPLKELAHHTYLLELFRGPTSSFKDFGARFLAECMEALAQKNDTKTTILVATSGDTGSAVASAFHKQPHENVIVLFPEGKISARQQQQIACWGDNIYAVAIEGTFDDCQRLVKATYQAVHKHKLSTANSINLGRLLPQMVYYAYTAWHFQQQHGLAAGFVVPSGNVGNVTACYWAQKVGFPIREVAIATNNNRVLGDYLNSGEFTPRASLQTLANAMDVGHPSNFERLRALFPDFEQFKQQVQILSVNDAEIEQTIKTVYQQYGEIICPHTATAFFMRQQLSEQNWIVVATAEAAKFETVVEPLLQQKIAVSQSLQTLLDKPSHTLTMTPDLESLLALIEEINKP